ncbi:MAG: aminotransferase class IV [Rhodobacterales bacterium]|nr:aminotransferase class IV [Rhodobacterales bacterium]
MEGTLRQGAGEPGLTLIETLAWDGTALVRLDRHLARLAAGAAALGWACDPRAAARALRAAVPAGPARMRLTLDGAGRLAVTAAPLPPAAAVWRVALAAGRLAAADPWLRIKSSRRPAYDAARAALPAGVDELILANEHDQVCDGTITTVFFDAGAGMCTPPLDCGLLPGCLRAELLAQCRVRQAVLPVAALPQVRLWVGNSARGLIPAVWTG